MELRLSRGLVHKGLVRLLGRARVGSELQLLVPHDHRAITPPEIEHGSVLVFRVSQEKGYAPDNIRLLQEGKTAVEINLQNREVEDGVWFPMHVIQKQPGVCQHELWIDSPSIRVNQAFEEDRFEMSFPVGTMVYEQDSGRVYISGVSGEQADQGLARLADRARDMLAVTPGSHLPDPTGPIALVHSPWYMRLSTWLFMVSVGGLAVCVKLIYRQRRHR
jgi:hypothetical protein